MERDVFDVLDVSLREDTYSSLLVTALRASLSIQKAVFRGLTGKALLGLAEVLFRSGIGMDCSKNHPDIIMKGQTTDGPWWLVIEAKIMAGEGWRQTSRYLAECEEASRKSGAGCTFVYLTLNGESPRSPGWTPLQHRQLAETIANHDTECVLARDQALALPWRAYVARLRHHADYPVPNDDDHPLRWLTRKDEHFVTARERTLRLGKALVPDRYWHKAQMFENSGGQQFLCRAWLPFWETKRWDADDDIPLEECVSVHFELDIPVPFTKSACTCHLHCETNPYMREKDVAAMGDRARRLHDFAERFKREIHTRIKGTRWRPANQWLQKARLSVPLDDSTTIGELRAYLAQHLTHIEGDVTAAMVAAAAHCGLRWAGDVRNASEQRTRL